MWRKLAQTILGLAIIGMAAAGCSVDKEVSAQSLEQGAADALAKSVGQRPKAVDCPGSIKAEAGATMRCRLTANDGSKIGLTIKMTDGEGHFDVQVDEQPMSG